MQEEIATYLGHRGYSIKKENISVNEQQLIRKELNVKPGFPDWDFIEGEMLTQLNLAVRGQISPKEALDIIQKRAEDVGPFTF